MCDTFGRNITMNHIVKLPGNIIISQEKKKNHIFDMT